jgi:hypothetical protein
MGGKGKGKPGVRRPLGRSRHRWVDNINMDLGEIEWGELDWSGSGKVQVESSCECSNEP